MSLDSLEHLYEGQICDLYSAADQVMGALPRLIEAASHRDLKAAFSARFEVIPGQKQRLDWILDSHNRRPNGHVCRGMRGVVEEAIAVLGLNGRSEVLDAGIVSAVRRVDYYLMAGYMSALGIAIALGLHIEAELLQESLFTEESLDDLLEDFSQDRRFDR